MIRNLFRKKSVSEIIRQAEQQHEGPKLQRHLGVRDLTSFGIAAIIGAGIFSTIGKASADGGPAVVFLFLFTAVACGFAAFAYAEFASLVPVSGSAYTYSYVAFGELFAWIIGWALIMEYAIGNIVVAISWSDYFVSLLRLIKIDALGINGVHIPEWLCMDYFSAQRGFEEARGLIIQGQLFENLPFHLQEAMLAWSNAPEAGFKLIFDLPALVIIILITALVYRGINESRKASNAMVVIKLFVVFLVIAVGAFYVDTKNWSPFAPNGISGILKGVSAVFFAYIGFDAISTTAEECKNPQRDLPKGMMYAIIICTILYMVIALVITGMLNYSKLDVGDPLAFVFAELNLNWLSGVVAVSAVVAMASVLLVFQLGQPRIWMAMSKDGLLPPRFSRLHPRFHTPGFATVVTGFLVAIPTFFLDLSTVADLCSIGTLFAFVLVCGGVLVLDQRKEGPRPSFKTPYVNARYIYPCLFAASIGIYMYANPQKAMQFVKSERTLEASEVSASCDAVEASRFALALESAEKNRAAHVDVVSHAAAQAGLPEQYYKIRGAGVFMENLPHWIFLLVCSILMVRSILKQYSLIPLLGMICCLYMMAQLGTHNWIGFSIWLCIGLVIYFLYSFRHSRLNKPA